MKESPFPYEQAEYEEVPCNLCLKHETEILCRRDRNALRVQTCMCRHCGLIFINPRMTAEWYGKYYQLEYREQMARFRGNRVAPAGQSALFENARKHGMGLAKRFRGHWADGPVLEVGSSTGGVLAGLEEELSLPVCGIEPSRAEADEANARGIKTYCALIEEFQAEIAPPGNIVCTQSLNHFLDPRSFLAWAHAQLRPGGMLLLEVMNFRHLFRRYGWMPRAVQIDHTYMFLPEVLATFVTVAGFDLVSMEVDEHKSAGELAASKRLGLPRCHMAVAARKEERMPFGASGRVPEQFPELKRSLDQISNSFPKYLCKHGLRRLRKTGRL